MKGGSLKREGRPVKRDREENKRRGKGAGRKEKREGRAAERERQEGGNEGRSRGRKEEGEERRQGSRKGMKGRRRG